MEIITRAEAKAKGLKRYFTGKPCERGHVAERRTIGGLCTQCNWRQANPEKARAAANPEKARERERRWAAANPEKRRQQGRQRYAANPEKRREEARQRYAANPEKARKQQRQRYDREKARERNRKYRHTKYCVKIVDRIDHGLESAKASGSLLDIHTAIDLFKAQDNAFEFLEAGTP